MFASSGERIHLGVLPFRYPLPVPRGPRRCVCGWPRRFLVGVDERDREVHIQHHHTVADSTAGRLGCRWAAERLPPFGLVVDTLTTAQPPAAASTARFPQRPSTYLSNSLPRARWPVRQSMSAMPTPASDTNHRSTTRTAPESHQRRRRQPYKTNARQSVRGYGPLCLEAVCA
jgi:hypothetical protein